jgi:hypothetical protein
MAPGSAGAWDDGSRDYRGDDGYPADGARGYGQSGGYPAQGPQGYGPQDDQYGDPYGQQPYGGYGAEQGQGGGGYGGPQGYQHDDYGYDRSGGYPAQGQSGGYPAQGRSGGYPAQGQSGGYPTQGRQPQGYDQRPAPGYGSGGGYQDPNDGGYGRSGGYPAAPPDRNSAPRRGGSGAYPALPPAGSGSYPVEDAGNDWYGGQPAAAKGASFADTGTYALNGRVIDEYGTGPRGAMRDPMRGYPPGPGQGSGPMPTAGRSGPMPVPGRPALPAPPAASRPNPSVAATRQQARLDEAATQVNRVPSGGFQGTAPSGDFQKAASGSFRGPASGAFQGTGARDTFEGNDGYNDYQDDFDDLGAGGDPYQDQFDGSGPRRPAGRSSGGQSGGGLGGKRLLAAAVSVVVVGIIGVAAYVFVLKPSSPSGNAAAAGPLPTGSAQATQPICAKSLGTYCHISAATDDPKPLTPTELFPPALTGGASKSSYSLVSTKADTKCANAVIGQALIKALQTGKCTQVVRGSYVSSDNKIMGTIGVVNLSSTNQAHYAGKVVGQNDFIAPLTSKTGVASKLGNGTGVVEAEFKGHYLILTWSEYVDGTSPTTKAQDTELEGFSNNLVSLTANIALSQRMVTGAPASPGATS